METALVIMAAGIGSRFGTGIKQLAAMNTHSDGSKGEIIMDYSIFDAVEAGFNRVVFIIRHSIEEEFKEVIGNRIEEALKALDVKVQYVYQELDDLPKGYALPEERKKPWGTGQAILACKGVVDVPFVIINADDYYGRDAFKLLHDELVNSKPEEGRINLAMAGFVLENTVSPNGTVTRGLCVEDGKGYLKSIMETHDIAIKDDGIDCREEQSKSIISKDSLVSMNMWSAYPDFIDALDEGFKEFLQDENTDKTKDEFLVPEFVGKLLKEEKDTVKVLKTDSKWIGITYKDDLEPAREAFSDMIKNGVYKENLWQK